MATFQKLNGFVEHKNHGVHDFSADQLKLALSNTAPGAESSDPSVNTADCILGSITQVNTDNLDGVNPLNVTTSASAQAAGVYKLTCADLTLDAVGGSVGPFRYVYLFNEDAANDELIGYWDYGASITLLDGESLQVDFSDANGVLTDT